MTLRLFSRRTEPEKAARTKWKYEDESIVGEGEEEEEEGDAGYFPGYIRIDETLKLGL